MKQFDAIIIGFGKGGKTLAADMAKRGLKVAMIERSKLMYGGTCINIGCIPSKTLVHYAKEASQMNFKNFEEKQQFYRQAIETKERVTAALRQKNYDNLANNANITVFTGEGSFVSADTVAVRTEKETVELQAPKIFINTGAESVVPNIEGITNNPLVHFSTSMLNVKELPKRLVIIGGGYIGLEFASMYALYGSQVTVLESGDKLIAREDRDIAAAVQAHLEKVGITFILNTDVKSVKNIDDILEVNYIDKSTGASHTLQAENALLATGRKPATDSLKLENAGVKTDNRGAIIVDERMVTSNPAIRALGDVKGGLQFTYISLDDYRIVRDDIFGDGSRSSADRNPVSYSVFIDPPMARIGLNEEDARRGNLDVRIKTLPVMAIPRAKTLGESDGLLKAVIENGTEKILGCTLFCPEASEIINTVALAMKAGLTANALSNFIFTHPSMSEALNDLFA